ncbi:MAG: DUF1289 domain-containing protein [Halieaceae bacterium]|jgi:predicted Fe-S protein YdhL (DUF1289 family)|nr:DUF1289 domain-containing protein [Halieaceae bacterium]
MNDEPQSPCVSVCALDERDICMGCYRSASEITDWFMATAEEKREILRRVEERRRADGGIQLL